METKPPVVLINMPFGCLSTPSIGLSLLKAGLVRARIPARIFYFQLRFAKLISTDTYNLIYDETYSAHLAGEWVFAESLTPGRRDERVEQYVDDILRCRSVAPADFHTYRTPVPEHTIAEIVAARGQVEDFLEECLATVIACRPRIVGFTSQFHQHVASLSLARRIKARRPDTFIVFGGPNCEGVMGRETLKQCEFVDAVVSGEGDAVFPALVRRILDGQPVADIAGVLCRERRALHTPARNAPVIEQLDELPFPDYDDYFEQLAEHSLRETVKPALLFETSRGCWWGEKQHCTFCGLNGSTMAYRSKSAQHAFAELVHLTDRHPGYPVNAVDNILDMAYFKDFIPLLAARGQELDLFYEVKANLKKEQLRLLRAANIRAIQPGVESFSDNVLRIMRKGVSGLQNIQLLKWCKELDILAYYLILWGFPGESAEDYLEMSRLVPLISHLPPPSAGTTIRIDRFSPNFDQAEQLGFRNLAPYPAYNYIYPFAPAALHNMAYFFTYEYDTPRNVFAYVQPLVDALKRWQEGHKESELFWVEKDARLLVWDSRPAAREQLVVLTGLEKFAYMACDQIRTARQVVELWRKESNAPLAEAEVVETLATLTARGLMLKRGELFLSLAVPRTLAEAQTT